MHRFFIPPEWIEKPKITFSGQVAHQIKNVLRMKPGWQVIALDNFGQEYVVILTAVSKNIVEAEILAERVVTAEPNLKITLYQGTLKAQKFEWVLQKGTELGISEFVPVISERSVLADAQVVDQKRMRWERIIQEAAEQSGRGLLPELRPAMMLGQAFRRATSLDGVSFVAWEGVKEELLKAKLSAHTNNPEHISLFIGSEGGFSEGEIEMARQSQIQPVGLGKRILRAETAGLVAASAIFYHFDEI